MAMKIDTKEAWIPEGYTLEYHNANGKVDLSKLALHLEPEQKEKYIRGEILAERMKEKGLNSAVLKYLLDNPKLIPKEWEGNWIYFFGTILRGPDGLRCVLCLYRFASRWYWDADWLEDGWHRGYPSAVLASSKSSNSLPLELPEILEINGVKYKKV